MKLSLCIATALLLSGISGATAATRPPSEDRTIDAYVRPYVQTNNFSGVLLVARDGVPVFEKAYGFADFRERRPNRIGTSFHVASTSMQYTAAATLRLVMQGKLSLDTPVSELVPELRNGGAITVRHLLTQTSGIHDINGLPEYESILAAHQTPDALVGKIAALAPDHPPGTFEGEEHSAYNLLALIIERKTGLPFADAVKLLVFDPLHMTGSGIDDDRPADRIKAATGHSPEGTRGLDRAKAIHWSAKAGNASAFTTARDELRFVQGLLDPDFLSPDLRSRVFDLSERVGYGWFKAESKRFGEPVYSMNGRAPGFSSAVIYVPSRRLLVVALSNIYASFTPGIASDVTAIALGRPYEPLRLRTVTDAASLRGLPAQFRFGNDFYQPNAVLRLSSRGSEVSIEWPTGDLSPLIPVSTDHYVDRAYGVPVEIVRDVEGRPSSLKYDRFTGPAASALHG